MEKNNKKKRINQHVFLESDNNDFIDSLIENKQDFILKQTNYSDEIIWNDEKFFINPNGYMNFQILMFRSKILSDIKKFESKNPEPKKIEKRKINYFDLGKFYLKNNDFELENVFCIDIKAAYPTGFKNRGFISEQTYQEMISANKEIRLKSCGSIATEKVIFEFKNGISEKASLHRAEKENYFFSVVNDIGNLMSKIKLALGNDFLFFWVDGIFFKNDFNICLVTDFLTLHGFEYKIELIQKMRVTKNENHLIIQVLKDGKEKIFNLPLVYKKRIKFAYNQ